ncbi:prolyl oligopeptidase family serine peptidase [Rhodocaloribacter litoris]|uniref:S9 family peptidase n=1 Tax=Rhodocaloribacter litoris TaxID=2558931 RepID=UPI0014237B94|nr:prolyl oligopeptidase family serine peptidase [Rhodocaloribacter litoris]QXD13969.1 prolyl oligopeptidase family serine peptidase [Rhodocaloribacter litoris]
MSYRPLALLCLVAVLPAVVAQARQPFTVEQVLSAPFPSDLVAAPVGARVAWVFNAEGVRNLWVADGPDFRGRPVTSYAEDDGQPLGDLVFTPEGERIIYVRGGDPNRQGEHPNPAGHPDGAKQEIWIVPVAGGAPQRLAEGQAPAVSPDGRTLAFLRRGEVWSVALDHGEPEPKQLFESRGRARQLRWSPDGARLAFVSDRGDHAFIGVYEPATRRLRYLDPSLDQDMDPVWSPDGRRIAFIRIPHERQVLPFMPRREALPWSIRVADVETGQGREVWRARPGTGSAFRGLSAQNQLFWGAGDRIVFPWEGDGWTHLYAVPVAGGEATLLTPGPFEVQFVSMTPDRRALLFSSNQDDIDRQHVWRVAVTGGPPQPVSLRHRHADGAGIEWAPVMTADGTAILALASSATHPAHPARLDGDTLQWLAPEAIPEDFPTRHLVTPRPVVFPAADGLPIHGQLFLPGDHAPGRKYPAVLFFHGGSRRQMLLGFHHRGYYHNAYAFNQYLAAQGFIVLSVNYRSGIGYGMMFREALNYGARGASEFNDVLGAGLYLRSRDDVDPGRIGLWGGSYGGYLTALGLARASDLFAAGVDLHGVHDWNVVIRNFVPAYDAATREEVARLAFASSPLAFIDTWRSPVLLIHGDDDRNVPFSESVDLAEALRRQGVSFEQLVFPDEVHGFLLHRSWTAAYEAAADFLIRHLKADERP